MFHWRSLKRSWLASRRLVWDAEAVVAADFAGLELCLGLAAVQISRMPGGVSRKRIVAPSFVLLSRLGRILCDVFLGLDMYNAYVVAVAVAAVSLARLCALLRSSVAVVAGFGTFCKKGVQIKRRFNTCDFVDI